MVFDLLRDGAQTRGIDQGCVSLPLQFERKVSDHNFSSGKAVQARVRDQDFQDNSRGAVRPTLVHTSGNHTEDRDKSAAATWSRTASITGSMCSFSRITDPYSPWATRCSPQVS